jgi:hypothetical protein
MKRTVVRYKTKPESAEENERLIKNVFHELEAMSPDGIHYLVLRLGDGSFVHFVAAETADGVSPLRALEAFQRFQSGIAGRCIDPPQSADAMIIGNYRMVGR